MVLLFYRRLIKEQEKSERQEAVRREREIRTQQLLEVSRHLPPNFLHVCLDLVVSFTQKNCFLILFGIPTFFCILSTCRACRMLSLCVPYLYIYTYIYYLHIYIYICLYIHIIQSFFNEYSCIEKLSYTIYPSNDPLTTPIVPGHMRHP